MNLSLLTSTTLVCFALCAEGVFGVTSYPNNPDSKPPTQWSSMENKFQQHCSPYGVSIFAKDWPRDKFLHACNMLAQLLDNDQDGCADDTNVVKTIRASQSGMALFPKDKDSNYDLIAETFNGQPLYVFETQLGCSGSNESRNCRDAAIEEIFHLVTQKGLSPAYKTDFAECDSKLNKISTMQKQMDIARGGHFVSVPKNYPDGSIYTYDDKTCDYSCQTTEFIYWALTSLLKGQDSSQISEEWKANTPAKMQSELPGMVDLLRNHPNTMVLFSANGVLPGNSATGATGTYNPPSMTCSNGCGLDGSGCGSQGNSFDIDICSLKVGPIVPTPTPPTPVTKPTRAPQRAPTKPPQSSPTPAPVTPKPPPGGGDDLNGEEACENNGFNKNECKNVGNDNTSCCQWDSGECYSNIGRESCPGTGTTNNIFSPSPPNNNGSCVDSSFKFKVTVKGKTRNKNCKWVRKNKTEKKCNFSGVRETCRKTCNGCE